MALIDRSGIVGIFLTLSNEFAFDHSTSNAEHLQEFQNPSLGCLSRHFSAILALFDIFLANAGPTYMRAACCGECFVGANKDGDS